MFKRPLLLLVLTVLALAGCAAATKSGAAQAVESYYHAIVDQKPDALTKVTCPEFADTARTELDSFQGVKMELQGFACQDAGQDGGYTQVKCTGKIVASYGDQKMDFPLNDRVHKVKNNAGTWQLCGY